MKNQSPAAANGRALNASLPKDHEPDDFSAEPLKIQRRQRQIEAVWRLGPRAVGELLIEVAAGADLGSDRFPAPPLRRVA